jgi:hypothetical protein
MKIRFRRTMPKGWRSARAVLVREWHGTKHQVTTLKDGFISGKRFQSLSLSASRGAVAC